MIPLLLVFIFFASFIASFFGLGGGILYTPFQLWAGVPFKEAASTSLFLILTTSISSTIVFLREKRVDWILVLSLEVPTSFGAFAGGMLSIHFSEKFLGYFLSLMLIIAGYLMSRESEKYEGKEKRWNAEKSSIFKIRRSFEEKEYTLNLIEIFPIMFVIGFSMSLLGLSGGIIKIPLMVIVFGIPITVAIGSSAFMVGVTALFGLLGHASIGNVNWGNALILILPAFLGAQIGSRICLKTNSKRLKIFYAAMLVLVSVATILKARSL